MIAFDFSPKGAYDMGVFRMKALGFAISDAKFEFWGGM
jgi:hypothetical protein